MIDEERNQSEALMHEPSIQNGMATIPVGRGLNSRPPRAPKSALGEVRPDKLEADGQTQGGQEAAGA